MKIIWCAVLYLFSLQLGFSQHDGTRDSVRLIARGDFEKVPKTLLKKPYGGDAEILFVEMLALLGQDQAQAALAKAREAVDAGLPFERLLLGYTMDTETGAADALGALHELKEFQSWKTELKPKEILHGPMLGNVQHDRASIWFRTEGKATVSLHLASGPEGDVFEVVGKARPKGSQDRTAVIDISDLLADTEYRYYLATDSGEKTPVHRFRTAPAKGSAGKFSIGFGGGAGFVDKWEYMWDTIRAKAPDAFLMLGDNVYIDDPEHQLTHHYCYYLRQARPEW